MSTVADDLAALEILGLSKLRENWRHHFRSEAPANMSQELLIRAVGYKIQEAVLGGLGRRTLLQLSSSKLLSEARSGTYTKATTPPPKSGTKLIREWRGKVHEVLTLENGQFSYAGKIYSSLTSIARQITKTHQSGPKFFGLKEAGNSADG
jgi:hypothetical protein